MGCVNARIDHPPDHAVAAAAEGAQSGVGLDGADRAVNVGAQDQVRPHMKDESTGALGSRIGRLVASPHQCTDLVGGKHAPHVTSRDGRRSWRTRGPENVGEQAEEAAATVAGLAPASNRSSISTARRSCGSVFTTCSTAASIEIGLTRDRRRGPRGGTAVTVDGLAPIGSDGKTPPKDARARRNCACVAHYSIPIAGVTF